MKKGWKTKNLGDLCDVIGGGTPPKDKPAFYSGEIPWATVRDMRQDVIMETEFRITKDAVRSSATNIIPSGNVVIATRVGLGKVCLIAQDTAINQDLRGIVPRSDNTLVVRYLYWWLKSIADVIVAEGTGATVQGVKLPFVKSLQIPVPSLPEQQRIVGILDEAFEGIATAKANAEKNLQNARALFESHLQSVFTQRGPGWGEKILCEVCDLQNGYAFKSSDYIESSNTLNIRMSSIRPGGSFDSEHNQRFLPDSYAIDYAAFLLKEGDLIIAMTDMAGDPKILGVPTLVSNQNGRNFLMNQRVGKLFGFSDDVRVPYLRYFLTSPSIKQYYKNKGAGGLQINISKGDILSARIPVPSIAVQDRIVEQLDALNAETQRLARVYERKLAALEALKKSLLHQAFTGQLTATT